MPSGPLHTRLVAQCMHLREDCSVPRHAVHRRSDRDPPAIRARAAPHRGHRPGRRRSARLSTGTDWPMIEVARVPTSGSWLGDATYMMATASAVAPDTSTSHRSGSAPPERAVTTCSPVGALGPSIQAAHDLSVQQTRTMRRSGWQVLTIAPACYLLVSPFKVRVPQQSADFDEAIVAVPGLLKVGLGLLRGRGPGIWVVTVGKSPIQNALGPDVPDVHLPTVRAVRRRLALATVLVLVLTSAATIGARHRHLPCARKRRRRLAFRSRLQAADRTALGCGGSAP